MLITCMHWVSLDLNLMRNWGRTVRLLYRGLRLRLCGSMGYFGHHYYVSDVFLLFRVQQSWFEQPTKLKMQVQMNSWPVNTTSLGAFLMYWVHQQRWAMVNWIVHYSCSLGRDSSTCVKWFCGCVGDEPKWIADPGRSTAWVWDSPLDHGPSIDVQYGADPSDGVGLDVG